MKRTRTSKADAADEASDFRAFLREQFRAAATRNSRFSLRSFARKLGINHSTLSQLLRNKRPLTESTIKQLGARLGLPEKTIQKYVSGSSPGLTAQSSEEIVQLNFDLDTFQLLSIWYHQAILELTHLNSFKPDSRWIAKKLGIGIDEVNIALQRLLRLGLLEMTRRTRWEDKSGDTEFRSSGLTEVCGNRVNQEVHELAIEAIKHISSQHRIHSHMILAIDSQKLPQLRNLANEFINRARTLATESAGRDDVYYVEVSLFPLTNINEGEQNG